MSVSPSAMWHAATVSRTFVRGSRTGLV